MSLQAADDANADPSRVWLPELVQRYARSLSPNEVACVLRLVNKATAAQLRGTQHATVLLSQPVPHSEFVWRWAQPHALRCLARRQRADLPCLTACSGCVANLEVLLARDDVPSPVNVDVFMAAAGAGQLAVCVWLKQHDCPWNSSLLEAAAEGGHQAVCDWLLANGCPYTDGAAAAAVRGGHVCLMDRLMAASSSSSSLESLLSVKGLLSAAAAGCDLATLQRLYHTHGGSSLDEHGHWAGHVRALAAGSPVEDWQAKLEWLDAQAKHPRQKTSWPCEKAAGVPDALPRLMWLRQRGYLLGPRLVGIAAETGNMELLQYLLDQGVGHQEAFVHGEMRSAACSGHVDAMKLLHACGAAADAVDTVYGAARGGHLPALAWLVETLGAEAALTAGVFASAAMAGSMELLAWLQVRGCPWDATTFAAAATEGSEEQLEWLVAQGCPLGDDGAPFSEAAINGDVTMLRCVQRLGCPWGPDGSTIPRAIRLSVRVECFAVDSPGADGVRRGLGWLLDQGCPVDWAAAEAVAAEYLPWLMRWLHAQMQQRA
ncbi:Ankyrin repeat domain-containing protein [Tetrabaena socialis]|uniref:Ankyrin repeat domain-containing protein n=1 Tax=Tetrabaena socialis TaxID=47790 RepID=A0A2J8AC03_9CHLO|nr:Ankyrin repeat domain-containing protein [Tetrabaena socialis]|eukprot:PNH10058.1 Ankyrin repeat domain-containing protein [Tetrabaena socialis]